MGSSLESEPSKRGERSPYEVDSSREKDPGISKVHKDAHQAIETRVSSAARPV